MISFILIPISAALSIKGIKIVVMIFALALITITILAKHRKKHQWRWRKPQGVDLLQKTGITLLYFVMLPRMLIAIFHGVTRNNGSSEFNWSPDNLFNPLELFREVIRIFPQLIGDPKYSIELGLSTLAILITIINILFVWKVLYLSEQDFLKDCKKTSKNVSIQPKYNINKQQSSQSLLTSISRFFSYRPFMLEKQQNNIVIKFNRVTTYDLQANFASILIAFFIFFAILSGLASTIELLLTDPDFRNSSPFITPFFCYYGLLQGGISYYLWNKYLRHIFTKLIIEFNRDELVVKERAFCLQSKILNISKCNLLPLQERKANTQVPKVRNTSLNISYRGKNIELAGHLLPEAMDLVQYTYDCYRNNTFSIFYDQTDNFYIE